TIFSRNWSSDVCLPIKSKENEVRMIPFNQNIVEALEKSTVKITDEFKEPPIMITISNSDSVIGTLGNFSASTGKAKSRKTFNVIDRKSTRLNSSHVKIS